VGNSGIGSPGEKGSPTTARTSSSQGGGVKVVRAEMTPPLDKSGRNVKAIRPTCEAHGFSIFRVSRIVKDVKGPELRHPVRECRRCRRGAAGGEVRMSSSTRNFSYQSQGCPLRRQKCAAAPELTGAVDFVST